MNEVIALYRAGIESLRACTDNSIILAWDNGLGVKVRDDGTSFVTKIQLATANPDPTITATNGNGERARRAPRQEFIAEQIRQLEGFIADIEAE